MEKRSASPSLGKKKSFALHTGVSKKGSFRRDLKASRSPVPQRKQLGREHVSMETVR